MTSAPHVLILEARFYDDIVEELAQGAIAKLETAGATHDRLTVPGAFEIPAALEMVVRGAARSKEAPQYDGYIALGCVIRGETSHYDYVCGESARKLQDVACHHSLALGYGILTCENDEQAWERANRNRKDKGGDVAAACLRMVEIRRQCGLADR